MEKEQSSHIMDFLRNGHQRDLLIRDGNWIQLLIRCPFDAETDFLYILSRYGDDTPFALDTNADYAGVYSHLNHKVYAASYDLRNVLDDIHIVNRSDAIKVVTDLASELIVSMVDNKPVIETDESSKPWNDTSYFLTYERDRQAYDHFYARTKPVFAPTVYIESVTATDFAQIINHPEAAAQAYAEQYIRKNAKCINRRLWELPLIEQRIAELTASPGDHHVRRSIMESIGDEKMVRLELDKDGIQMDIRIDAACLRRTSDSYSRYCMDAPSRKAFDNAFGRSAKLLPGDIVRILHGKRVLYERDADRNSVSAVVHTFPNINTAKALAG